VDKKSTEDRTPKYAAEDEIGVGEVISASGYKQELDRNFSLLSICAVGIRTDNTWAALGRSIVSLIEFFRKINRSLISKQVVAIYNGGPPGVIYELWVLLVTVGLRYR